MNFEGEDRARGGPGVPRAAPLDWTLGLHLELVPVRGFGAEASTARRPQLCVVAGVPGAGEQRGCGHGRGGTSRAGRRALPSPASQRPASFWVPWGRRSATWGTRSEAAALLSCQHGVQPSPEHRSRGQHRPPRNQNRTKATSMAPEKTSGSEFPNQGLTVHSLPLLPGGHVPSMPGTIQSLERGLPGPGWATSKLLKD